MPSRYVGVYGTPNREPLEGMWGQYTIDIRSTTSNQSIMLRQDHALHTMKPTCTQNYSNSHTRSRLLTSMAYLILVKQFSALQIFVARLSDDFLVSGAPNTCQNRKISSPTAVATVYPSGLRAKWRTLDVWPVNSAIFTMEGYFHRHSWFWLNPWELRISFSCLLHWRAHTWDPLSMLFTHAPVCVFQNLMHRLPVPPLDSSKFLWNGHHARALTAAWCSSRRCR